MLEKKVDTVTNKLLAYGELIEQYLRCCPSEHCEHLQEIRNEFNKCQIFEMRSGRSTVLLAKKFYERKFDISEKLLASLMRSLKFQRYAYQFYKMRFFNSILGYYFNKDILLAKKENAVERIVQYDQLRAKKILFDHFPVFGLLSSTFLLQGGAKHYFRSFDYHRFAGKLCDHGFAGRPLLEH